MTLNALSLAVALFALMPLRAVAERAVSQQAPMAANGTLEVRNVQGDVLIKAWDRNEVSVSGEIGYKQKLEFSADGEHTLVEVRSEDDSYDEDEEADLLIQVPATVRVRASTVSADITVDGLTKEQRLQSVSGDITTQVYGADVEIGTISGTIWVDGHDEVTTLRVSIVSGEAQVTDVAGDLTARTVSGDLTIRAKNLRRTRIDTTSGSVDLRASLERDARFEVDSTSGDLRLELCGEPNAEYELSSFSGEIRALDGRRGEPRHEDGPTTDLRFKAGDGSSLVRVNSLSGNIYLDDC